MKKFLNSIVLFLLFLSGCSIRFCGDCNSPTKENVDRNSTSVKVNLVPEN